MPGLFQKPISPHLSPNAQGKDVWFAIRHILNPFAWFTWLRGSFVHRLENYFKREYSAGFARGFDRGRSALYAVLEAMGVGEGDEVVLQGFTCVVVPNAIIATSAEPVYVDIDSSYNIDPEALRSVLSDSHRVKVVIVQHTFGVPADVVAIKAICDEFGVLLLEDCALSLGATVNGKKVGTFGDAAIFSFGRNKAVSSVSGGMAIVRDAAAGEALNRIWLSYRPPSFFWVWQRLMHIVGFWKAKRFYYTFSFGKAMIRFGRSLNILPDVLSRAEKEGKQAPSYRFPNVLAKLTLLQLERLGEFTEHRRTLAQFYYKELSGDGRFTMRVDGSDDGAMFLRFPVEVMTPESLLYDTRQDGVLLGDWYGMAIGPTDCSLGGAKYGLGSCPVAEESARHMINLPTNITTSLNDARRVVESIKKRVN